MTKQQNKEAKEAPKEEPKQEEAAAQPEPSKEVATRQSGEVATFESGEWGAGQEVTQEDLVVAKVLIMQPQSRTVIKGQAKQGEFRNSLDDKLYGDAEKGFDVIIFNQDKVWVVYEITMDRGKEVTKWKETMAWTPANAKLEWNETVGGVKLKRQKAFNFYCIVRDKDYAFNLPVIVRMKSTSYNTGKRLSTLFAQLAGQRKPSASRVLTLSCHQEENDQGIFYVWDFKDKEASSVDEQKVAYKWWKGLKESQFKVDESEEEGEEKAGKVGAAGSDEVDFL